jgi:DNA-binding GntR family transcriptional regulator
MYNDSNRMRSRAPQPRSSTREKAYRYIQSRILSGEFEPGGALSELAVSRDLGISRTPVREAIGQLVAEGLLEQIPNRGALVVEFSRRDIVDLFELREALEVFAIRKLAENGLTERDLVPIRQTLDALVRLREELERGGQERLDAPQSQRFVQADLTFHSLLLRAADNQRMLRAVADTRLLIRIFSLNRESHTAEQLRTIEDWHGGILDAIVRRDAATAGVSLAEHIQTSCRERLAAYDANEIARLGAGLFTPQL